MTKKQLEHDKTRSHFEVGGHSPLVRYHTFCCFNALEGYEDRYGGATKTLSGSRVGDHSLSVRYQTFCCSNALKVNEKSDGAAEKHAFMF